MSSSKVDAYSDEEYYDYQTINVDPGQEQVRIDKYLLSRLEQVSRNRLQTAIKAGAVMVNDKQVKPNYKVRPKDVIKVVLPKHADSPDHIIPEDIPLDIVYEDDHLLVINKAAGLVVHPGTGNHTGTLVNALVYHFKSKNLPVMEGNTNDRPGLVHRLDKDTTGLMVIAKTESAMTHLAKQFFDHSIERSYQALVWSGFEQESGTIEGHIGRHPTERIKMHVFADGEEGKHATTHYKVIDDYYYVSLVECRLETGRTHQIRVHMNHVGHPVFNDDRYGGDRIRKGTVYSKYRRFVENCFELCPRQALHAKSLGFIHPETSEAMRFESELPADMVAAIERWRAYFDTKGGKTD
jgi:23S rRNA pseudouridine1911/1915/1917 synthase